MFVLYITNLIIIKWVIHLLTLLLDNLADQYQEHIIMQITDKCLRQKNLKWSNNHRNIFLYLLHLYFIKVSKCLVISMWSSTWNDVLRVAGRFLIFPFFCSFPACEPGGDLGPTTGSRHKHLWWSLTCFCCTRAICLTKLRLLEPSHWMLFLFTWSLLTMPITIQLSCVTFISILFHL